MYSQGIQVGFQRDSNRTSSLPPHPQSSIPYRAKLRESFLWLLGTAVQVGEQAQGSDLHPQIPFLHVRPSPLLNSSQDVQVLQYELDFLFKLILCLPLLPRQAGMQSLILQAEEQARSDVQDLWILQELVV